MTQKEEILEILYSGPSSKMQLAERLGMPPAAVAATLLKLIRAEEVRALNKTWPRLYHLMGECRHSKCSTIHEPEDLFNVKPSLTKCSYCKKAINKRTREVERRETGANNEIQRWGWCKPCFKKQLASRQKGLSEDLAPHVSRLPVGTFPLKKGLQDYGR